MIRTPKSAAYRLYPKQMNYPPASSPRRTVRLIAALGVLAVCQPARVDAQGAQPRAMLRGSPSASHAATDESLHSTLAALYDAFSFDKGREPNWKAMHALFLEGAAFVAPVKPPVPPRATGEAAFLSDFRHWVRTSPDASAGFRERVIAVQADRFGAVAHAYVVFEGFVPGEGKARTRGLDSIQLVLDGERWRVASFTTQFESAALPLPERFLTNR